MSPSRYVSVNRYLPNGQLTGVAAVKAAKEQHRYLALFLLFVFVLPLWPAYAQLKFAGLPNLAPDRLIRTALFFGFIWIFFTNSPEVTRMKERISRHWVLVSVLLAFYGIRIASAALSDHPIFQLYALFRNELLVSLPVFFFALLALDDEKSVKKVFVALTVAGVIASVFALIEFYRQKNLFMGLVPITSDYLMGVFLDKTRDSAYRAQGTFEHPIILGQFFTLTLPITWTLFKESKGLRWRLFYASAGVLALASVYASGSRLALGLSVLMIMMLGLWEILVWVRSSKNRVLQYLVVSQLPLPIAAAALGLYLHRSVATGNSQETIGSTTARLDMLFGGIPKLIESPVLGHGLGEAVSVFSLVGRAGLRTLDNYYLLLGIESGILVPVLLVVLLFASAPPLGRLLLHEVGVIAGRRIACALVFFGYGLQMAIHSLSQQVWLVLIISACVIVLDEIDSSNPITSPKTLLNT